MLRAEGPEPYARRVAVEVREQQIVFHLETMSPVLRAVIAAHKKGDLA